MFADLISRTMYRKVSKIHRGLFQNFFFKISAYFRGRRIIEVGVFSRLYGTWSVKLSLQTWIKVMAKYLIFFYLAHPLCTVL